MPATYGAAVRATRPAGPSSATAHRAGQAPPEQAADAPRPPVPALQQICRPPSPLPRPVPSAAKAGSRDRPEPSPGPTSTAILRDRHRTGDVYGKGGAVIV